MNAPVVSAAEEVHSCQRLKLPGMYHGMLNCWPASWVSQCAYCGLKVPVDLCRAVQDLSQTSTFKEQMQSQSGRRLCAILLNT